MPQQLQDRESTPFRIGISGVTVPSINQQILLWTDYQGRILYFFLRSTQIDSMHSGKLGRSHQFRTTNHHECGKRYQCIDGNTLEHGSQPRFFEVDEAGMQTDGSQRSHHPEFAGTFHHCGHTSRGRNHTVVNCQKNIKSSHFRNENGCNLFYNCIYLFV